METIGDRIKSKRKEAGMTQLELASKLNVTDRAVSKWEQNEGNPDISILPRIADLFNVTLDYLMTGIEPKKEVIIMSKIELCAKNDDPSMIKSLPSNTDENGKTLLDYVKQYDSKKVLKALEVGIDPILCVGETLEEREAGNTKDVCKVQVEKALENVSKEDLAKVVIAYEPVWAIGTGKTATSEDANDVIAYIREVVANLYGELANEVRIQYGGSVKPSNVAEIMNQSDIDGALVGGASLEANDYVELVNF